MLKYYWVIDLIKNLKKLRQDKKISQQQLADFLMVSQQSVNKYENHNVEPDIATLCKIADYFDVTIDYLVGRTKKKETAEAPELSDNEAALVKGFRLLTPFQKDCIIHLIESYNK